MRSSSGPCGLSAQRLFAAAISSAAAGQATATRNKSLKRVRAIATRKAQQGPSDPAADRPFFEKLAHLRRRTQLVRLGGERRVMQGVLDIGFAEHFRDAAIDEELRLRGVTEDLEPGVARGVREGAEVDMGAHVLLAGMQERVAVRLVAVMAHQRAHRALRVVILMPRKAVVDDEDSAFGQLLAKRTHPGARRESDLALIGGRHLDCPRSVQATACTGIASTTSLAMTVPAQRCGSLSMNCTRFPRRARWRSRNSALVSRMTYSQLNSSSRVSASAPLPAPTSSTEPPICPNCLASVRPNSLPSSGAVTKSPAQPNFARSTA